MFSLKGKTAVLTGASRGIGAAMATALAEAGADVILIQVGLHFTALALCCDELLYRFEIVTLPQHRTHSTPPSLHISGPQPVVTSSPLVQIDANS